MVRQVRLRRLLAMVLLLALGCTACGGGQRTVEAGDITIYVHGGSLLPRGGFHALIEGQLAVRDGCVVLQFGDEEFWTPVVWPAGTSIVSSAPLVLELPSGVDAAVGDTVSGGGGHLDPTDIDVAVAEECPPDSEEIAVFNPDDNPSVS